MISRYRAWVIGFALLILAVALCWWMIPRNAQVPTVVQTSPSAIHTSTPPATPTLPAPAAPTTPVQMEPLRGQKTAFLTAFLTPISFWGKVVDEKGNPVPGATVKLSANNNPNPMGQGAKYQRITDEGGLFSIAGIHGIALGVEVSKAGYYQTAQSSGMANYVLKNNTDRPVPTPGEPAIFILRKKGQAAELNYASDRPVKIPKNGMPVEISLKSGEAARVGSGDLRVECWTEDQKRDAQGHYPWRCRVSVPGGGLIRREGEFDFEAPAEGYTPYDELTPSTERWSAKAERRYFVKTADNHFARVNLRMRTGGEHFVVIETYFNPQAGSRNLEYDPSKQSAAP